MRARNRMAAVAATTLGVAALFVAGALAASADSSSPPAATTTDAVATTTDVGSTTTDPATTTTTTVASTTTTAPAPTTTAAAAATTTDATSPAAPITTTTATTTTAPTTTSAPASPPAPNPWWVAFLAWLAEQQHRHQAPATPAAGPDAGSAPTAQAPSAPATNAPSTSGSSRTPSSSPSSSSGAASVAPAAQAAPVVPPAYLVVTGTATPGDVTVGSTVTYTFIIANQGGRSANASLTDVLPADVAPIGVDSDQGTCSGTQQVHCGLGSIAPGQTVTVTIVVQVTGASSFENTAALTVDDPSAKVDVVGNGVRLVASAASPVRIALPKAKSRAKAHAKPKAHTRAKPKRKPAKIRPHAKKQPS